MNLFNLRNSPPIHELSLAEVEQRIHQVRMNRVVPPPKPASRSKKASTNGSSDLAKLMKIAGNLDPETLAKLLGD